MIRRKAFFAAVVAALSVGVSSAAAFVEPVAVLHTFEGTEGGGAQFGWAVSELRDVNGDGVMEAIVSEPFNARGGSAYVYSGRDGSLIHRFDGRPGDSSGYAIADAGDTNGDGVADVIVGAPGRGSGHAYLYSGRTGALLHTFEGVHAGDFFGVAVSSAGDNDRDGFADVLVGAPRNDSGGANSGRAYVFSGKTGELLRKLDAGHHFQLFGTATDSTDDLDRDGVTDLIVGARQLTGPGAVYVFSGANGRPIFRIDAPATGVDLGLFFAAGIGDVDGDGVPDVYAADVSDTTNGPGSGRAAVYSGRDGNELWTVAGGAFEGAGPGREAGDHDGDGRPDIAVGFWTAGPQNEGRVEIRSGRTGALLRTITSDVPGATFGFDAVGIGDVNGDGRADLLASAATVNAAYVIAG